MATRNQLGTTILAKGKQRASKGPRKKRIQPEPRQYTMTDLDRARDRVEAAERRVDADRTDRSHSRTGLQRAQRELHVIESDLRARGISKGRLDQVDFSGGKTRVGARECLLNDRQARLPQG